MSRKGKGWWSRNWKWFVPVGCLGILVCIGIFVGVVCGFAFMMIRASDPYQTAVAMAKSDPRVTAALGGLITTGLLVDGSINERSDWSTGSGGSSSGSADLHIPLHGPKGEGNFHAVGIKANGKWTYQTLIVEAKRTKQVIDLNKRSKKTEGRMIHYEIFASAASR